MNYIYNDITIEPNLDEIHTEISSSSMINKNIEWCRWDEDTLVLEIVFNNELDIRDKNILDEIINNII